MKDKIVNLVKQSISINLADIAQELFITVTEAREHASIAISEALIKFNEDTELYYYDFEVDREFNHLNDLNEII